MRRSVGLFVIVMVVEFGIFELGLRVRAGSEGGAEFQALFSSPDRRQKRSCRNRC